MFNLTSSNYLIWKPRIEDTLLCEDLYDPINDDSAKPQYKSKNELEWLKRKNVSLILQ